MNIKKQISSELELSVDQVGNVLSLIDSDATIPFIARYRKELTGGLDEVIIRKICEKYGYLKELGERKNTVIKTIEDQGRLTNDLKSKIKNCMERSYLEDIYLPFRPKKKTRASIAREKGLEPFLVRLLASKGSDIKIEVEALKYVNGDNKVKSVEDAIKGASDIFAEIVSEKADVRDFIRKWFIRKGFFFTKVKKEYKDKKSKFEIYYNYSSPVKNISSHNMLGMIRAEKNGVIKLDIDVNNEEILNWLYNKELFVSKGSVKDFLSNSIQDSYNRLIKSSIISEVRLLKKKEAELAAVLTFEKNLSNLLLSPPVRDEKVLAVDPGFRSGCKVVVLDEIGTFLEYKAIYPHPPLQKIEEASGILFKLIDRYSPKYVAIGNGTAARETERFIKEHLKKYKSEKRPTVLLVSEAGASVYSASKSAAEEFPDLDILVRGAISIGRRLIDPLAELVKIDPKSIGVGQYQHDVDQKLLKEKLADVVESCVNHVGVDLNCASVELLSYVSGISSTIAKNIVTYRKEKGLLKNRKELLKIPRLGKKAYEQASGFLRIKEGDNPLDNSAVHPESYHIVGEMTKILNTSVNDIIGNTKLIEKLVLENFIDKKTGRATICDILDELKKPGRDPRSGFTYADFDESVNSIEDLNEGLILEGVITNVANFGAFVDIGVHTDGLVHISQISNKFVKNPDEIVKVGQTVKVKVLTVDIKLKRISLAMKGL